MQYILEDSSSDYINYVKEVIDNNLDSIFNYFNSSKLEMTTKVYIYKSKESLISGLNKRGYDNLPSYVCACFRDEDNSLNLYEEDNIIEYKRVIYHELIHAIVYRLYGYLDEWLNEGIAKILDGTYKSGIKYLLDNYINKIDIPKQEEIINEFGMHDYDSYDYAYIMVSYIIDKYGKSTFIEMLKNKDVYNKIYSDRLLLDSINYYNNLYKE